MMCGHEKSHLVIVAMKPANKAKEAHCGGICGGGRSGVGRAKGGAKGNAHQHNTYWTQSQARVPQALERIRQLCRHTPEVGAVCGKAARTVLCGGRDENRVPTATTPRVHHAHRRFQRRGRSRRARSSQRCR